MSTYQDLVQEFIDENKVQSNGLLIEQPTVVLTHSRNPGRGRERGERGERGGKGREGGGGRGRM